jgi:hypothetical protein
VSSRSQSNQKSGKRAIVDNKLFIVGNIVDIVGRNKYSTERVNACFKAMIPKRKFQCSCQALCSSSNYCGAMKWHCEGRRVLLLKALMLSLISSGCSAGSGLAEVKGRVTFKNGEAIQRGSIEYDQIGSGAANQSGARIVDGAYEIPRAKGLRPGKYIVRIHAASGLLSGSGAPGSGGSGHAVKLPEETVSPKFNSQSSLAVEVTDESTQTFDFEVEQIGKMDERS